MLVILDLRLIGCYKIKQGILQQNLSKYHRFESADNLSEQKNIKEEEDEMKKISIARTR